MMEEQKLNTGLTGTLMVTVLFDYQPVEPMTDTYPGCGASVELNSVYMGGYDLMPVLSQKVLSGLEDKCLKSMDNER